MRMRLGEGSWGRGLLLQVVGFGLGFGGVEVGGRRRR